MHGPVAGGAMRTVRIAGCSRLPVDALPEGFHFVGMALRALYRGGLGRGSHLVRIAMAGLTSSVAQHGMNAVGHMRGLVGVASRAANFGNFVGMREVLDGGVAVDATQSAMGAGRMFGGIN